MQWDLSKYVLTFFIHKLKRVEYSIYGQHLKILLWTWLQGDECVVYGLFYFNMLEAAAGSCSGGCFMRCLLLYKHLQFSVALQDYNCTCLYVRACETVCVCYWDQDKSVKQI